MPITPVPTDFTLGSRKDLDVGLLLFGSKDMALFVFSFKFAYVN